MQTQMKEWDPNDITIKIRTIDNKEIMVDINAQEKIEILKQKIEAVKFFILTHNRFQKFLSIVSVLSSAEKSSKMKILFLSVKSQILM